jgi:GNAT superfamily N-acetyltransferase
LSNQKKLENHCCRTFVSDDEQAVKALLDSTLEKTWGKDYWNWKYKSNPNFDPSFIAVAEVNGKIIGCNHWIPFSLRLTDTLSANVVLAADLVVDPAYRGKGVATKLLSFLRSSTGDAVKKKEIIASYMMTGNSRLDKNFFNRSFGYVPIKNNVITYHKLLNLKGIQKKIDSYAKSKPIDLASNQKMRILFNIRGMPKFILNIEENNIDLTETDLSDASVVLTADLRAFELIKNKPGLVNLLKMLFSRKIKIRGGLKGIIRLYRNRELLLAVFGI